MHRSLQDAGYDPDIVTFPWSGANSFVERDQTAKKLAGWLDKDAEATPNTSQIVIGHSHGGNIILSAARDYRQSTTPIHLVTLATPFLDVICDIEKSPSRDSIMRYDAAIKNRLWDISLLSAAATMSVYFVLGKFGWKFFEFSELKHLAEIGDTSALTLLISIHMFVASLIFTVICIPLNIVFGKCEIALNSVAMFDTPAGPGASSIRLLVLRGTDDEASLALAAGSVNRLITETFSRILLRPISIVLLIYNVLFSIVVWFMPGYLTLLVYSVAGLIMMYLLFSVAKAVSASSFGRELLIAGVRTRVYSNSAPDSICNMKILTLHGQIVEMYLKTDDDRGSRFWKFAQSAFRLRHSLYENKKCIPSILAWLKAETSRGELEN